MRLNINFRNVPGSADIISHVDRRLSFCLSRMEHEIERVDVTLSDLNGPKAGVDKQCKVVIKPIGLRKIVVTEKQQSIQLAVDVSLARAGRSLVRKLKRKTLLRRGASIKNIKGIMRQELPEVLPAQ